MPRPVQSAAHGSADQRKYDKTHENGRHVVEGKMRIGPGVVSTELWRQQKSDHRCYERCNGTTDCAFHHFGAVPYHARYLDEDSWNFSS